MILWPRRDKMPHVRGPLRFKHLFQGEGGKESAHSPQCSYIYSAPEDAPPPLPPPRPRGNSSPLLRVLVS